MYADVHAWASSSCCVRVGALLLMRPWESAAVARSGFGVSRDGSAAVAWSVIVMALVSPLWWMCERRMLSRLSFTARG